MASLDDKSLLEQLDAIAPIKQFDAFPKIPASYKARTKFGGFMTIFVIALSFLLVLNDIGEFIWGWSDYEFAVDRDTYRTLDINVDVIVNSPCGTLSIDLRDAVGDRLHLSDTFIRDGTTFDIGQAHEFKEHQRKISTREVVAASRRSRGFFSLFKASRPVFRPTYNHVPDGKACRIYGSVSVRKLTGNLHITSLGHGYETQGMGHTEHNSINMSHVIQEFSFGKYYPDITQPLDYSYESTDKPFVAFQYFITVVPTSYVAPRSSPLHTYQYSVTHYVKEIEHARGTPGIFFKYDIDPVALEIHQRTTSITQFLVRIVGVIGGVWVCFGWGIKVATKVSQKAGLTRSEDDGEPITAEVTGMSTKKRWGGSSLNLRRRDGDHNSSSPWSTPMGTPAYGSFSAQGAPSPYGSSTFSHSRPSSPYAPLSAQSTGAYPPPPPSRGGGSFGFPPSPGPTSSTLLAPASPYAPSSGFPTSPGFPASPLPNQSGFSSASLAPPGSASSLGTGGMYAPSSPLPTSPGSAGGFATQQQRSRPTSLVGTPPPPPRKTSALRNEKKDD